MSVAKGPAFNDALKILLVKMCSSLYDDDLTVLNFLQAIR
jgi:hypothetical protein